MRSLLRRIVGLLRGLVFELSDQAAYSRYLERTGRQRCAGEWKRFTDARYRRKYANAKCC